ncbi:MAG: hypothetical protein ABIN97_14810 [Ginsengibacter sp.]
MQQSITIQKNPVLNPGSDYNLLRQKGLDYIQELGSKYWTDYNIHDPGITILEALCYAITDLGYRTSLDIKDLLAEPENIDPQNDRQGFYTAREILTVSPWTLNDYRKLLIDIDGVKNGWLHCKECPCDDIYLYANCEKSILQYTPAGSPIIPVIIKGLYDVLIEFEDEEKTGNLNSGKIKYKFNFASDSGYATADIEIRLPSWYMLEQNKALYHDLRKPSSIITEVTVHTISKFKHGLGVPVTDIPDADLGNALRRPVYVTLEIKYDPGTGVPPSPLPVLLFEDVPMTVWFSSSASRKSLKTLQELKTAISDITAGGIMPKYAEKIKKADEVIAKTSAVLHANRNLDEDYCTIKAIEVEDIAICADMEVEPSADIEAVLAEAFYLIDQYFSADIKFYSLKELFDGGKPVDEIFEGPKLHNGFIDDKQLESTNLKKVLYASDIINLLMDIPGVISVKNFILSKYDADGNVALKQNAAGKMVPDNDSWFMNVSYNHQPRLYIEACKVLVFKNGLPFLPDRLELSDSFLVIKGKHAQPKYFETDNDFAVPAGRYFDLQKYYPVQNSLPVTYGVGELGLSDSASPKRKSQAKQLKAYLMFFEQLLLNYLYQLSHIKELFAIDKSVEHTYFSGFINNELIAGLDDAPGYKGIYKNFNEAKLEKLIETKDPKDPHFLDRRNRFLDHLLARFGEEFNEYALMLYAYTDDRDKTDEQLINDKIDFLKGFPFTSANRGRGLNYKDEANVCSVNNMAGLQKRIELLLDLDDYGYFNYFEIYQEKDINGIIIERGWRLIDKNDIIYLKSPNNYLDISKEKATEKYKKEIAQVYKYFTDESKYTITKGKKGTINLKNDDDIVIATHRVPPLKPARVELRRIISFAKKITGIEKLFIVEHLLLRPRIKRNPALYFELYEEKDIDGKFYERRWRLIDSSHKIYLSSSTRYSNPNLAAATALAKAEINAVWNVIGNPASYEIKKEIKWVLNLLDPTGEVIATRKQHFLTEASAVAARNEIIKLVEFYGLERNPLDAGDIIQSGNLIEDESIGAGDPLLPVCLLPGCGTCGDEDPYSFRITVVINGEDGPAGTDMDFRQFAEQTIRLETPAHLGVKVCWVSKKQLLDFSFVYCAWRTELAKPEPDAVELHNKLVSLLEVFNQLKNIYPPATLHDCADGNDENRVLLGRTII